jgi:predicted transglutaminase-like cysteine proteinase
MAGTSKTRRYARALAWTAAALVAASPAMAKKAEKKRMQASYEAASLIAIPKFSPLPARAVAAPAGPATFFTINDALAKRDGRRGDGAVRLAAADPTAINDAASPAAPAVVSKRTDEPFGMELFRAPEGALWIKWRRLSDQLGADEKTIAACSEDDCTPSAQKFVNLVNQVKGLTGRAQLERVNQAVNAAVAYATDLALHGEPDRWSAPLATLQAARGDCEDYAFLKRQVLLHAGVKPADLRIVLLRDTAARGDHAVLSARAGGKWYVLDNRRGGFFEESELPHYLPLFAIDETGLKLFAVPFASLSEPAGILPGVNAETDEFTLGGGLGSMEPTL